MFETILTQELSLPVSKLRDFEDKVPLPRFIKFQHLSSIHRVSAEEQREEQTDSVYHFHFLSQIAHRIILSRVQRSVYYFSRISFTYIDENQLTSTATTGDYASPALVVELLHQLEQWRSQLPLALQFDDVSPLSTPKAPGDVLVLPLLRARYVIARYHLARPLL